MRKTLSEKSSWHLYYRIDQERNQLSYPFPPHCPLKKNKKKQQGYSIRMKSFIDTKMGGRAFIVGKEGTSCIHLEEIPSFMHLTNIRVWEFAAHTISEHHFILQVVLRGTRRRWNDRFMSETRSKSWVRIPSHSISISRHSLCGSSDNTSKEVEDISWSDSQAN